MELLESTMKAQSTAERAKVFEELYEQAFPPTARFVRKMGGSLEDAKDIFQDALVIFYEKTIQEGLLINTSPEAYIHGISKHLWVRKFKQDSKKVSFSDWEHEIETPKDDVDYNNNLLLKFLEQAGKKCMDLLRAFYYSSQEKNKKLSMGDIAQKLGYKNERSATVQKYKCLGKVRDTIKEKSIGYEDFTE
jgi:DNA-directed RNA polymerase specialized sigma24 family protein